jgi:hypothetical protein
MLKSSNFRRSLGGQPREGVVHGPNPCTHCRSFPLPKSPPPKNPPSLFKGPPFPISKSPPPPSPHLPPLFLPFFSLALGGGKPRAGHTCPWFVPSKAKGGKGEKRGGISRGEESGGKEGRKFHPTPPIPRPVVPHIWARSPNFRASVFVTAHPAQKKILNHQGSIIFFL